MKTLTVEDFEPADLGGLTKEEGRIPPQSYLRLVMTRLSRNVAAIISAAVIFLVVMMALLGPLLWTVDPAKQNLAEISLAPVGSRAAWIIDKRLPWPEAVQNKVLPVSGRSAEVSVVEANTERVRLVWTKIAGVEGYRVYRHLLKPSGPYDRGLPLADLEAAENFFEDRVNLKSQRYYYSVVPLIAGVVTASLEETRDVLTIEVEPEQAVSLWDAQLAGLIEPGSALPEKIILPAHPLGTDYLGRDILARIIQGARTSLFIGVVAPLLFIGFGSLYGAIAGFFGGRVDQWMMRIVDFVIALPFLLFMILFKVMFGIGPGESGVIPMLIALILLSWPDSARLVRGQVLQLREQAYVDAARLLGGGSFYIIVYHLLPNIVGLLLVAFSFAIPAAIFTEAFLSFIGLGVVPPTPSWGSMCNDGIRTMLTHPHELLFPALLISLTVLAFNLLGDGLRDALDHRSMDRGGDR